MRTKQTACKSTGGKARQRSLVTRKAVPSTSGISDLKKIYNRTLSLPGDLSNQSSKPSVLEAENVKLQIKDIIQDVKIINEEVEKLEKACDFTKMLNVVENLNLQLRSVLCKTEDLENILEEFNEENE